MKKITILFTLLMYGCIDISNDYTNSSNDVADVLCTPTTCLKEHKNCGEIDDGCGNTLQCGNCDINKYQYGCGIEGYFIPDKSEYQSPLSNVCGGGCFNFGEQDSFGPCQNQLIHKFFWSCLTFGGKPTAPIAPSKNCIPINSYDWCCDD